MISDLLTYSGVRSWGGGFTLDQSSGGTPVEHNPHVCRADDRIHISLIQYDYLFIAEILLA